MLMLDELDRWERRDVMLCVFVCVAHEPLAAFICHDETNEPIKQLEA